jgi:hypothetical protein
MQYRSGSWTVVATGVFVAVAIALGISAHAEGSGKAWGLRDHYSFDSDTGSFRIDIQTAEWGVALKNLGDVVNFAYAEIETGDGKSFALNELKSTNNNRDTFKNKLGSGTVFRSIFPATEGLEATYSVARFKDRPFILLSLSVKNTGDKPISIASLKPAVFSTGVISGLTDTMQRTTVHTVWRGGFPLLEGSADASLVRFQVPRPKMTLGIGLLQSGEVDSHISLKGPNSALTGAVESRFDPPLQLDPGETVSADPIWLSVYIPDAKDVQSHHSWTEFSNRGSMKCVPAPHAWVTVDAAATADDLVDAAKSWGSQAIVHYALVPYGWERKVGSLEGATPRYPKNMGKVAAQLARLGMRPGITLDPLATDKKDSGVVIAVDGSRWLQPGNAKAQKTLEKRIGKLSGEGFRLYVVPQTTMPDDVLVKNKLTRVHAYSLALDMLRRAAPDAAVVPAPALSMDESLEAWRHAAETTATYQAMGYKAGPVRFAVDTINNVPDDLIGAIQDYAGSVEVVGRLSKRRVRTKLTAALETAEKGKAAR